MVTKSETSHFRSYAYIRNGVHHYGRLHGRLRVKDPGKPSASTLTTEDGGNRLLQIAGSHAPVATCREMNIISNVMKQFYEHAVKSTRNTCLGVTIISCRPIYKKYVNYFKIVIHKFIRNILLTLFSPDE